MRRPRPGKVRQLARVTQLVGFRRNSSPRKLPALCIELGGRPPKGLFTQDEDVQEKSLEGNMKTFGFVST